MTMRGVRKPGAKTVTSAVRGQLRDAATRAEAMSLILGADPGGRPKLPRTPQETPHTGHMPGGAFERLRPAAHRPPG